MRVEPYTSIFIHHNGKLDSSNRMFTDVEEAWDKVWKLTQWNNELTPEWFYLPRIFQNKNWIDFGVKDNGDNVSDIVIPDKFKSHYFLYWMHLRKWLRDSTYSKYLNIWLDLIFGSKQQKRNQLNVFFKYGKRALLWMRFDKYYVFSDSMESELYQQTAYSRSRQLKVGFWLLPTSNQNI